MKNFSRDDRSGGYKSRGGFGGKKFGGGGNRFGGHRGGVGGRGAWSNGNADRDAARPDLHDATCAGCGNACRVPFRPTQGRPVYCRDCFKNEGSGEQRSNSFSRPSYGDREEKQMFNTECSSCGTRCEVPFRPMGTRPVYCKPCFTGSEGAGASERNDAPSYSAPRAEQATGANVGAELAAINAKLDTILTTLNAIIAQANADEVAE